MKETLSNHIDDMFTNISITPNLLELRDKLKARVNINYNQILNSGFSEYIAIQECKDSLDEVKSLLEQYDSNTVSIDDILASPEQILLTSIKSTAIGMEIDSQSSANSFLSKLRDRLLNRFRK